MRKEKNEVAMPREGRERLGDEPALRFRKRDKREGGLRPLYDGIGYHEDARHSGLS